VSVNRLTFWDRIGFSPTLSKRKGGEPIISVQTKLEIHGDIKLAGLSRDLDEANVNREILKAVIVKAQDHLIDELCGKKYARNKDAKFKRAGTVTRTLITRHGKIGFKLVKVKSLENGSIMRLSSSTSGL